MAFGKFFVVPIGQSVIPFQDCICIMTKGGLSLGLRPWDFPHAQAIFHPISQFKS